MAAVLVAVLAIAAFRVISRTTVAGPRAVESTLSVTSARVESAEVPAAPSVHDAPPTHARADGRAETVVYLRAAWGTAVGEFGRKRAHESNPEAPMAIAARGGDVVVLDQVNGRVQRLHDGSVTSVISGVRESAQDLTVTRGATAVLDRLGGHDVAIFDEKNRAIGDIQLVGKGIDEGGGVTGLFADDEGVFVEREHGLVVRIAGLDGLADSDRPTSIGRPSRNGTMLLRAAIVDPTAGALRVQTYTRSGAPIWACEVNDGGPLHYLLMLDSDRRDRVYVAADVGGTGSDPSLAPTDEAIVMTRIDVDGAVTGSLNLPSIVGPFEMFRPLSIDDDGAVYEMLPSDEGLVITRTTFP